MSEGADNVPTPAFAPRFPYLPELDGLRAVAIGLVIVGHTMSGSLALGGPWHRLGELGVMLFFVLSGFLITGILCASEEAYGRVDLREFYLRRALRIFPAAYAFLAACAVAMACGWISDTSWKTFAAAALYLRNIFGRGVSLDHLWSLSLEEQFYVLWPPVMLWIGVRRGTSVAAIAACGVVAFRTMAILRHWFPYESGVFYERPWFRFDSLLVGCWFALLRAHHVVTWRRLVGFARWLHPLWVVPAAITWSLWGEDLPGAHAVYLTIQLGFAAAILLAVLSGAARGLLTHSALRAIGRLSYSLYLWQQTWLVSTRPSWGWIRAFPINLLSLAVSAVVSYRVVERPLLRLKDSPRIKGWLVRKRAEALANR